MDAQAGDHTRVHDAFISYSRRNREFAVRLEKALENYAPPKHSGAAQRRLDVFRDETDFTGVDYHSSLDSHLHASAKLIVVCSPDARRSTYVNDEIRRFAQAHGAQNIVPVLVAGVPNNEALPGHEDERAFPDALCEALEMPLAANYLNFNSRNDRIEKGPFEGAWYLILANLHGVSRAVIEDRERKRHARRRRIQAAVVGSVMTALAVALVVTLISRREAVVQRGVAQTRQREAEVARDAATKAADEERKAKLAEQAQRERADERSQVALSRQLAAQALTELREGRLDSALLLDLEAQNAADTLEARSGFLSSLVSNPRLITFLRSAPRLSGISFSGDGKTLAVAGEKQVMLWNIASQRPIGPPINGDADRILTVALSPDGYQVAHGTEAFGKDLRLWDTRSRRPIRVPLDAKDGAVRGVVYSPDGRMLATGLDEGQVGLWDTATLRLKDERLVGHRGRVTALAFSPDSKAVAGGGVDGTVIVWDATSGQRRSEAAVTISGGAVETVAFSPDGRLVASAGSDRTITIWSSATGQVEGAPLLGHTDAVNSVAFNADGKLLASGSADGSVILWDVATRVPLEPPLRAHTSSVQAVSFNTDGTILASGEYDGTVILWDVLRLHRLEETLGGYGGEVRSVALSPDGRTLASADCVPTSVRFACAGQVHIADVARRQRTNVPVRSHVAAIQSLSFTPDGRTVLSGSCAKYDTPELCNGIEIRAWAVASGRQQGTPRTTETPWSRLYALALGSDGATAAAAGCNVGNCDTGEIAIWSFDRGGPFGARFPSGRSNVDEVVFSPDGYVFATTSNVSEVVLWDARTSSPVGPPFAGDRVGFSPDGKLLAVANMRERTIAFRDGFTGQIVGEPLTGLPEIVTSLAFSPDARTLAAGGLESKAPGGTISLWDVPSRRPIGQAWDVGARVNGLVFSHDSSMLVSAGRGVEFWDMNPASWRARACRIANRNLTYSEWQRLMGDVPYRATCSEVPLDVDDLTEAGARLARDGNLSGAAAVFRSIPQSQASGPRDPDQEARKLRARALVEQGEYLARSGNVARSIELFRGALAIDPSLDLDPSSRAGRLAAPEWIARGRQLVKRGLVTDAVAAFARARTLDAAVTIDAFSWRDLCHFGSAFGHAKEVLSACTRVVTLEPSSGEDRDARGMARALSGDYAGAIDDLEAFLAWRSRPTRRLREADRQLRDQQTADRQRWIAALRRRENPFASEMLDELNKP